MAVQIAELSMPRGKKGSGPPVIYAEVSPMLKIAVEDEVLIERRGDNPAATITSFTTEALIALVNQRRAARGLPPIEAPAPEQ